MVLDERGAELGSEGIAQLIASVRDQPCPGNRRLKTCMCLTRRVALAPHLSTAQHCSSLFTFPAASSAAVRVGGRLWRRLPRLYHRWAARPQRRSARARRHPAAPVRVRAQPRGSQPVPAPGKNLQWHRPPIPPATHDAALGPMQRAQAQRTLLWVLDGSRRRPVLPGSEAVRHMLSARWRAA